MDMIKRIETILKREVRPMVEDHGGGVRLVEYTDGTVWLELTGACSNCPAADLSTRLMIEDILRAALPEVKRVELTQEFDPELLTFMQKAVGHPL